MAENEDRPFQRSDLGGATTKIRHISTTTPNSYVSSYISSNHADVLEIVLESVLCFLTSNEDRNAASLVCKSWYEVERLTRSDVDIVNCKAVSPRRVIDRFQGRVTSISIKGEVGWLSSLGDSESDFALWLKPMTKAYRWLEKVYLKGMLVDDDDFGVLARSFPDLKELVLVSCQGFEGRGLGIVASECKQIKVFELIDSEIETYDGEHDWISCFPESSTSLESFLVDCVMCRTNFEALERLVTRSPSLKKLRLSCDISISELHRLIVRAPQLTHFGIGISGPGVEEQGYADLAACKSLKCLFGFVGIVPAYLREIVPVCANLKSLDFTCTEINAEEFESVIFHCHQLQTLHVSDLVGDKGLKAVAATCKDLRELLLLELDRNLDSEVGMLVIFKGCRRLQYIKYDCRHVTTNASLVALSESCPDLRVLHITVRGRHSRHMVRRIPEEPLDEGIMAIVQNCKKITRLQARFLLTDRAFEYIGKYGKGLRSLCFDFTGDSDMGLKYVLEGCSKLKKLKIINCPFGDASLRAGSHHYNSMKFFLCMNSGRVTRVGCAQIARLLLENFGLEAHVLSCNFYRTTDGSIKICLKRR